MVGSYKYAQMGSFFFRKNLIKTCLCICILRYPDLCLRLQLYDVRQVEELHTWTIGCSVPIWVLFHKSLYDYHLVVGTV